MPRLAPLPYGCRTGLDEILRASEGRMGFVPNSQLIIARRPEILRAFAQLGAAINGPSSTISPQLRNMVSQMASRAAGCGYCMAHTAHTAERVGIAAEKENALWEFEASPLFSVAERAALRVAQGAAQVPNAVTRRGFRRAEEALQRGAGRRHRRGDCAVRLSQPLQRHDGDRTRELADRSRQALPRRARLDRRQARRVSAHRAAAAPTRNLFSC